MTILKKNQAKENIDDSNYHDGFHIRKDHDEG